MGDSYVLENGESWLENSFQKYKAMIKTAEHVYTIFHRVVAPGKYLSNVIKFGENAYTSCLVTRSTQLRTVV